MNDSRNIADFVFSDDVEDIKVIESRYKPRDCKVVTRIAPSPTGYLHFGAVYTALVNYLVAKQVGGRFMMRIEDTDQKREVEGTVEKLVKGLHKFGISCDEGFNADMQEVGDYGPYIQSHRRTIYRSYAKEMLKQKKAYLCFCSEHDLENMRNTQVNAKERTGYYGKYAVCRDLSDEEVWKRLDAGTPYVLRLRSQGYFKRRVKVNDIVRGERLFPENDVDPIIMKASDGLPTYHFAHVIDDHLMGTTHVIRADEWLPSLTLHVEMFNIMGWTPPLYAHLSPIQKMEGDARRKLSKRKDPEANVEHYFEEGYPIDAVIEYLLNLANSNFEDWRKNNPTADVMSFPLDLAKTSPSGALFDQGKLDNISKRVISEYTNTRVYDYAVEWAKTYDADFLKLLTEHEEYIKTVLNIERTGARKRKDILKWSSLKNDISYFFDHLFAVPSADKFPVDKETLNKCLDAFAGIINETDDRDTWWEKVKSAAESCGFASDNAEFKKNPTAFKGNVSDYMKIVRVAITGLEMSPDIFEIIHAMGIARVKSRLATYR